MEHIKKILSARLSSQFEEQIVQWTEIMDEVPHLPVETLGQVVMAAGFNIKLLKAGCTQADETNGLLKVLEQQKNNLIDIYTLAKRAAQLRIDEELGGITRGWQKQLPTGVVLR